MAASFKPTNKITPLRPIKSDKTKRRIAAGHSKTMLRAPERPSYDKSVSTVIDLAREREKRKARREDKDRHLDGNWLQIAAIAFLIIAVLMLSAWP